MSTPPRSVARQFRAARRLGVAIVLLLASIVHAIVHAQAPQPGERITFAEAIARAVQRNPSAAIAAAGILRAEALLGSARSAARLQVNGSVVSTTFNTGVEFEGVTVTPRSSATAGLDVRMPIFAPAQWARRTQAEDQRVVAEHGAAEARRQTALATADAYLAIIALRRVVEANVRAREVARAHFDLATELERAGTGSRLNQLRAQQEFSTVDGVVESARLALYRAQEALGVLIVADGPVDAAEEPTFDIAPDAAISSAGTGAPPAGASAVEVGVLPAGSGQSPLVSGLGRTDLRLFAAQQQAAERALNDSRKEYWPLLEGIFQPASTYPSQFFSPSNSWRLLFQVAMPIYDSGQRAAQRLDRQALVDISRATLSGAVTASRSEVRTAREAVASAERGLVSVRAAAEQAQQVVEIVNVSFRAGAATNIEVIDAERRARDADTAVAVAEDALRRARFELLDALGRFP
jgi:outer membrane protein TolC